MAGGVSAAPPRRAPTRQQARRSAPDDAPAEPGDGLKALHGAAEPAVTKQHVVNALGRSLGTKLYGAQHLRRQAAIAKRREERLGAAKASAAQLIDAQQQLVNRSVELRHEVQSLQVSGGAAAARLGIGAQRVSAELGGVHDMEHGLEHLLDEQSDGLARASGALALASAARPQTLPARALLSLEQADWAACDAVEAALSAPERMAGSAEAWSVQLALQNSVDVIAERQEAPLREARKARREDWIAAAKLQLLQLKEQLGDEQHQGATQDYEVCARLRNEIGVLKQKLLEQRKLGSAEDRFGVDEAADDAVWVRPPQRRLVAMLNGTFALPVDEEATVNALNPFGQVQMVPNPFSDDKRAVRTGSDAQHLLFGEKYTKRWDLMKAMVYGLVEEALATAPVHRPPSVVAPAVWEWRDKTGRRVWHRFEEGLAAQMEETYAALTKPPEPESEEEPAPDDEEEEVEPPSPVIRWSEAVEDGGSAAFVVDLERMLQYPERQLLDVEDSEPVASVPELVAAVIPTQPLDADYSKRILHPLVRELAREVRRRDDGAAAAARAARAVARSSAAAASAAATAAKAAAAKAAAANAAAKAAAAQRPVSPAVSPTQEPRYPRMARRDAESIEDAGVRAAIAEATKLGKRDKALPNGTRIWVQDLGEGWYEGYARFPKYGARRGPATHTIRFEPHEQGVDSVRSLAGRAKPVQLVGPTAPKWEVLSQ